MDRLSMILTCERWYFFFLPSSLKCNIVDVNWLVKIANAWRYADLIFLLNAFNKYSKHYRKMSDERWAVMTDAHTTNKKEIYRTFLIQQLENPIISRTWGFNHALISYVIRQWDTKCETEITFSAMFFFHFSFLIMQPVGQNKYFSLMCINLN